MPCPVPRKPDVQCDASTKAAQHNADLLRVHNCDFAKVLAMQRSTTLDFGSKFRPANKLKHLLGRHTNFAELEEVLSSGMPHQHAVELNKARREQEGAAQIRQGQPQVGTSQSQASWWTPGQGCCPRLCDGRSHGDGLSHPWRDGSACRTS
jgi:hypothetical protein